ncbi:glycine cleavage system protein GcvH [Planctomycetota bacterium]
MVIEGLYYTNEHEWLKLEGETATVGITDYAQNALGEITFIELPIVGKKVEKHGELAVIESSKAASEVYSPVAGEIVQANDSLDSEPELINKGCYEKGWICKLKVDSADVVKELMDSAAYQEYLSGID